METKTVEFEEAWQFIQSAIKKLKGILEGGHNRFSSEEFMFLYTIIYKLCTELEPPDCYPQQLYVKYRKAFEEYIRSSVLPAIREKHDEFMLSELVKRWANHKIMVRCLSCIFHYLDCHFIPWRKLPDLKKVGLSCFRDMVNSKARDAVIVLINREREGEQIDRALLKNVLDIFVEIGMGLMEHYVEDFEKHMLLDTDAYYCHKASNWIVEYSCPDYMSKAEECLKKERERVSHCLHLSSELKLMEKAQYELLVMYANKLLEMEHSGCCALLRNGKIFLGCRLFHKIPKGLEFPATIFKQHITAEGTVLVRQAEEAASDQNASGGVQAQVLIRKMIELHDKYTLYVNNCFQNHARFHEALKEAFEVFCNKTVAGRSSAEPLAAFCDNILKKGGATEETLEKVLRLLPYITDKDLFAEFCRKNPARRLLFGRSTTNEPEMSILTKLKQKCGSMFTSKMERMVTDVTLGRENQANFNNHLGEHPNSHPGIDMSVTVLTSGFWPSYKSTDLKLPAEMLRAVHVFKEFYNQKSCNRKLTWIYSLGSCHINSKFKQKTIELIVSIYQAAILLLFNTSDRLSYSEIMTQTNLAHDHLNGLLHSLSCAKYKILTKEPNTKTVSQTDYFEFNHKFTDKMRRIKIPLPPVNETKKVIEVVEEDRRYAIDATIVRIMKSRRELSHQQLVSECANQLSHTFKPQIKALKKWIEAMIDGEYLERDRENPVKLRYLA